MFHTIRINKIISGVSGCLLTPDYKQHDMGVSLQSILDIVNSSKCKDKFVILDSCFSGNMGVTSLMKDGMSVIGEGVTILTACREIESAVELDGHGVFTALLLNALSGEAADLTGHITIGGIYAYVDNSDLQKLEGVGLQSAKIFSWLNVELSVVVKEQFQIRCCCSLIFSDYCVVSKSYFFQVLCLKLF